MDIDLKYREILESIEPVVMVDALRGFAQRNRWVDQDIGSGVDLVCYLTTSP